MVDREPGAFAYFQDMHAGANGDTIRAAAVEPGTHTSALTALTAELDADDKSVTSQLEGDITDAVRASPQTAADAARVLAAKGYYAIGLLSRFALAVDDFDYSVSSLNQRYRADLAMAMRWAGQAAASTPSSTDDAQVSEAKMGPAIKANLRPEYSAALATLDDAADDVAAKYKQGSTADNVRELVQSGLIPIGVAAFYPGLQLTDEDRLDYYLAIGYLPDDFAGTVEDNDGPHHWWDSALDGIGDAGTWTYNHTIVPGVNTLANYGQALLEHPEDALAILGGLGLVGLGGAGEVGGVVLDATGIGAVIGVPANVVSAGIIAAGGTMAIAGAGDLGVNASQNHNTVLNEAGGSQGGGGGSTSAVDDALNGLPTGRSPGVRTVGSDGELEDLYGNLAKDGKPVDVPGYKGSWVERDDGVRVGLRDSSKSGGRTIDIRYPDGTIRKVHVE